ncbi:MAG: alanine racemase [Candidatus Carbobacillus altaicus]|nr:alanine racemase [Candidatus Carbobacillus altaicus]
MSQTLCRPTYVELDEEALIHNVRLFRAHLPPETEIIAVVKANAYGHGIFEIVQAAQTAGIHRFAVATVGEALELRAAGLTDPILVFGPWESDCVIDAQAQNIALTVYDTSQLERLKAALSPSLSALKVHLKIDTGMHRYGLSEEETIASVAEELARWNKVAVEGLYSHYADADDLTSTYSDEQYARFLKIYERLRAQGLLPPLVHLSNSAGAMRYPERSFQAVRLGIALYGLPPEEGLDQTFGFALRPVLRLKSEVVQLRTLAPGETVSYHRLYTTPSERRIATIPVGYGDGMSRRLSQVGEVLIRGERAGIVGRVTMDAIMVDVTHLPLVRQSDEVVLIGRQGAEEISALEVARWLDTSHYEVTTALAHRLPRLLKHAETREI